VDLILDEDRLLDSGRQIEMEIGGSSRTVTIEFFRRQHGRFVMKFAGIDSIEDAEKIIGAELRIRKSSRSGRRIVLYVSSARLPVYAVHEAKETIGDVTDVVDGGGTQLPGRQRRKKR
jgi:ribosomal 30S subunit maturation factor RimM